MAVTIQLVPTKDGSTPAYSYEPGESVILNIAINNATNVAGCALTLRYNTAIFTAPATDAEGKPVNPLTIQSYFPFIFINPSTQESTVTHREKSAQAKGLIHFAGAAIDNQTGGAPQNGERDLFMVKMTVRTDAPSGPVAADDLMLEQTELLNQDAGWGTDTGSDGIFDEAEVVPVLTGASPNTDTEKWNDGDLANDFFNISHSFTGLAQPIIITDKPSYSISGTIAYTGAQTGMIYVGVFSGNTLVQSTSIAAPGAYLIPNVPAGTGYVVGSFRDSDNGGSTDVDASEAQGISAPFDVSRDVSGKNVTLLELDSDQDGMPDYWEAQYGDLDPSADNDSDGYSNLFEFQNGTIPIGSQDPPHGNGYNPATDNRKYQLVSTSPATPKSGPGDKFTISVNYITSDYNANLSGLGLRIHYDSSKLTWESFSDVLSVSKTGEDAVPTDDTVNDFDNDPATDKFLVVAWASLSSVWPGSLPAKLYGVTFSVAQTLTEGVESTIRFSASSKASDYEFFGKPVEFKVVSFNLDIDGNGVADALTDGLLIIRYLFDFRGDALIAKAVASDATRKTAPEIEAIIASGDPDPLDIDGNGAADALTDGLLILRYLFDFRKDALIANAVASDATRNTAPEIEAHIESIMP